jgi:hypothetical protein
LIRFTFRVLSKFHATFRRELANQTTRRILARGKGMSTDRRNF